MSDAGGIYIVAGEASGDLHAANLVRALQALRPGIETRGMGGPRLAETGCAVSVDLTEFAVMGLVRVVPLLGRFLEVINRFRDELAARRPAAVVLIDYPGLNFILAGVARRLAIPVVYYCCPQLWAWAPWRVRKLQRLARLLLVIFPFEEEFFRGGAAAVKYVGHPICDALAAIDRGAAARELRARCGVGHGETLVGSFPGSRRQEVAGLVGAMAAAARNLAGRHAGVKFAFSCLAESRAAMFPSGLPVITGPGEPLMAACDAAMVASGTAALELAFFRKPMTVVYPLAGWKQTLFRAFTTTPFISTVNLLAGEEVVGERFIARPADVAAAADDLSRFLGDAEARRACERALAEIADKYLLPGASARAAAEILELIEREQSIPEAAPGGRPEPVR